jgi:hypothetical protein
LPSATYNYCSSLRLMYAYTFSQLHNIMGRSFASVLNPIQFGSTRFIEVLLIISMTGDGRRRHSWKP